MSQTEAAVATRLVPREDTVICEDLGHGESSGGIVLPEAHRSDHRLARVIAVSSGWNHAGAPRPIENIEPGDLVVIKPNRSVPLTVNGEKYIYVSCLEIPVVIKTDGKVPLVQ